MTLEELIALLKEYEFNHGLCTVILSGEAGPVTGLRIVRGLQLTLEIELRSE